MVSRACAVLYYLYSLSVTRRPVAPALNVLLEVQLLACDILIVLPVGRCGCGYDVRIHVGGRGSSTACTDYPLAYTCALEESYTRRGGQGTDRDLNVGKVRGTAQGHEIVRRAYGAMWFSNSWPISSYLSSAMRDKPPRTLELPLGAALTG